VSVDCSSRALPSSASTAPAPEQDLPFYLTFSGVFPLSDDSPLNELKLSFLCPNPFELLLLWQAAPESRVKAEPGWLLLCAPLFSFPEGNSPGRFFSPLKTSRVEFVEARPRLPFFKGIKVCSVSARVSREEALNHFPVSSFFAPNINYSPRISLFLPSPPLFL